MHIFIKKRHLIDCLAGFVDIHNHLLPGLDDGAQDSTESIELINSLREIGVRHLICTPHIMHNYYENTPEDIRASYTELKSEMDIRNIDDIKVDIAAEHMIDDNFENILEDGSTMPLSDRFMLIEMSYLQPPINFDQAVNKIKSKGYFPILAHPERYSFLNQQKRNYYKLKEEGILLQMNLLSIAGFYGKSVQRASHILLEENLIDFAASDLHNMKQLNYLKETKVSAKSFDKLVNIINSTNEYLP